MGAFGPNQDMKDAQGYPGQLARWMQAQLPIQFGNSALQYQNSTGIQDWLSKYYHDLMVNGAPTIQQQQDWGHQIMPGIPEAMDLRGRNLDTIQQQWSNLPIAGDTMSTIDSRRQAQGQGIGGNQDFLDQLNRDTYGRTSGREASGSNDIQSGISSGYGGLDADLGNAYRDMRGTNRDAYGNLINEAPATFDQANANLEMLKPGGQFQQAQVARSFAPAVAATAGMLRRGGIDANSPEAFAAQQRVQASRARAMDDTAGATTQNYVNSKNSLALQALQNRQGLTQSQLGNELSLADRSIQGQTGIGMEQTRQGLAERLRTLQAQQGLDLGQAANTAANQRSAYGDTQKWYDAQNNDTLLGRQLGQQDWQTQANLVRERNQEPLLNFQLNNQAYGLGAGYGQQDQATRQAGAQGWGGVMNTGFTQAQQAFQNALNSGKTANEAYQIAYAMNAPDSGWLTKLLAGAAPTLINTIFPGAGTMLGGLIPGLGNNNGGGPLGRAVGQGSGPAPFAPNGGFGTVGGDEFGANWSPTAANAVPAGPLSEDPNYGPKDTVAVPLQGPNPAPEGVQQNGLNESLPPGSAMGHGAPGAQLDGGGMPAQQPQGMPAAPQPTMPPPTTFASAPANMGPQQAPQLRTSSAQWDEPWLNRPTAPQAPWGNPIPPTANNASRLNPQQQIQFAMGNIDANGNPINRAAPAPFQAPPAGWTGPTAAQNQASAGTPAPTALPVAPTPVRQPQAPAPRATQPLAPDGGVQRSAPPPRPSVPNVPQGPAQSQAVAPDQSVPALPEDQQNPWMARRRKLPGNPWGGQYPMAA